MILECFCFFNQQSKCTRSFSILLIVLRVEERAVSRTPVVHIWHLGGAPWLTTELLGAVPPAASVVVTGRTATHVIELGRVVEDELHRHWWQTTGLVLTTRAPVHPHRLLRRVLIHVRRLLLLMEPS